MSRSSRPQKAMKRKRKSKAESSNNKKRTSMKPRRSKQTQPFRLLDLPAELRNDIYEKIAKEETAHLNKMSRGNLGCSSALPYISRQVRDEFLVILTLVAPGITTTVSDWDFTHIVRFLNRLSDAELKAMPTVKQSSSRKMNIWLRITCHPQHNMDLLTRWLNRMTHPTK